MPQPFSTPFVRSAVVGLAATLADVLTLLVLIRLAGFAAVAANLPALLVGVTVQYIGNKHYAFEDRSRDHLRQATRFAGVEAGTLALNAVGFHLLVSFGSAPYWLARTLVTLAVYCGFSFPLWKRVFRRSALSS